MNVLKQPRHFWDIGSAAAKSTYTNYHVEDMGIIVLSLVQKLINTKSLYLDTIVKIGKISHDWRRLVRKLQNIHLKKVQQYVRRI